MSWLALQVSEHMGQQKNGFGRLLVHVLADLLSITESPYYARPWGYNA